MLSLLLPVGTSGKELNGVKTLHHHREKYLNPTFYKSLSILENSLLKKKSREYRLWESWPLKKKKPVPWNRLVIQITLLAQTNMIIWNTCVYVCSSRPNTLVEYSKYTHWLLHPLYISRFTSIKTKWYKCFSIKWLRMTLVYLSDEAHQTHACTHTYWIQ